MKNTSYKKKQGESQARLIEQCSFVFYGAKNRGIASWIEKGHLKERESRKVLKHEDREKNLYAHIRENVIKYVKNANIRWWHMESESDKEVSAHTLSSQVSCFNHLFLIRNDEVAIKTILKAATGISFDEILPSLIEDNTFISFEFVFHNKQLLKEDYETRGAKCTSVDALIYARKDTDKWLIPIEWKYTEAYDESTECFTNYHRYDNLVSVHSRLPLWLNLYHKDPFYELARQTLLMERIIELHPVIANKYFHIIVIPNGNKEMRADAAKFGSTLKQDISNSFQIITPSDLLLPIKDLYPNLIKYLYHRYWQHED